MNQSYFIVVRRGGQPWQALHKNYRPGEFEEFFDRAAGLDRVRDLRSEVTQVSAETLETHVLFNFIDPTTEYALATRSFTIVDERTTEKPAEGYFVYWVERKTVTDFLGAPVAGCWRRITPEETDYESAKRTLAGHRTEIDFEFEVSGPKSEYRLCRRWVEITGD
jgi:hypothetical protein